MKRKTIMAILGVIGAVLVFLQQQFNLSVELTGVATALGVIVLYIFFEAKRDIEAIRQQVAKWADPKFWLAFIVALVTALNSSFGWDIPVDIVNVIVGFILSILFKAKVATA